MILDLERRGLLDETLVVCISEHGRTPKIASNVRGGGRDHWSQAYSAIFSGGGIARGRVVGATDRWAGEVKDRPVSPKDLLATMYHLLGVDPRTRLDRPDEPSDRPRPRRSRSGRGNAGVEGRGQGGEGRKSNTRVRWKADIAWA